MPMIGIVVNVLCVILGGLTGTVFGKRLSSDFTEKLNAVFGVCAAGMGISSIVLMENMPAVILSVVVAPRWDWRCTLGIAWRRPGT